MLVLLSLILARPVTLDAVYAKVRTLPGVEINAEMVRPSTVFITFRIAPGGRLWAKYPTSEDFITQKEKVTWMPDSRQFARSKPEPVNPLPGGFEAMWPDGDLLTAAGVPQEATFANQTAVKIPCKPASGDYTIELFVNPATLLPMGTVATANGTTFEIRYKSLKVRAIPPKALTFTAPTDARPYSPEPPGAKLLKPGAKVDFILGKDADGKPLSVKMLMVGKRGMVLNFWFSACTGCIKEMPYLTKLHSSLKQQQIELVGINSVDPVDAARKTSKTNALPFRTLVGPEAKKITQKVGVMAYPVTMVLDSKGVVVDSILGFNEAKLLTALKKVGYSAP